jgi:hypothetical protein
MENKYTQSQLDEFNDQEQTLDNLLVSDLFDLSPDAHSIMRVGMGILQTEIHNNGISPFSFSSVDDIEDVPTLVYEKTLNSIEDVVKDITKTIEPDRVKS